MNLILMFSIFITLYLISDSSCNDYPKDEEKMTVAITTGWKSFRCNYYYENDEALTNKKHISVSCLGRSDIELSYKYGGIILNSVYVCLMEQLYKKYTNAANFYMNLNEYDQKLNGLQKLWKSITMLKILIVHMINGLKFFNFEEKAVLYNLENFKKFIDDNTNIVNCNEHNIDNKFNSIINIVEFDKTLKEFKQRHVVEVRVELEIVKFINSLCGVHDTKINDNELIDPDQNNFKIIIKNGIYSFYSQFGLQYYMFNQNIKEEEKFNFTFNFYKEKIDGSSSNQLKIISKYYKKKFKE
ncbi:uncharacterized protein LOC126905113 isoform X2 [Daktulosphaira vitifoliae]|uniref:uncharacterized protein LOC126905113 isoform X1 n=1 Tax=Daktulosphaira vitifoliae TaxID=58002 RepID=UPI0021A9BB52|nr:uncharacterized protein LOC126905113 isoform X1 [Daktulosphaira vitifoliae]XP_050540500.1 uncharacterized protein LOC126905113 isoform X2 [Daktulosphaira vitifoliae]